MDEELDMALLTVVVEEDLGVLMRGYGHRVHRVVYGELGVGSGLRLHDRNGRGDQHRARRHARWAENGDERSSRTKHGDGNMQWGCTHASPTAAAGDDLHGRGRPEGDAAGRCGACRQAGDQLGHE